MEDIENSSTPTPPLVERHEQGKFSTEETSFLKEHLPAYEAMCHALEEEKVQKGYKKKWVLRTIYPEYVKRFSSNQVGGPLLESLENVSLLLVIGMYSCSTLIPRMLEQKITRWFTNRTPHHKSSAAPVTATATPTTPKRPRATNGANIFAAEQKAKITGCMAQLRGLEGADPKHVNLSQYQLIKKELYKQLSDDERQEYEVKAAEKNQMHKALPNTTEIFK